VHESDASLLTSAPLMASVTGNLAGASDSVDQTQIKKKKKKKKKYKVY
jgi:hypothetical protein